MANCVFGFSWREGRGRREAEFYFELDERQTQTQGVAVKMPASVSVEAVRRQLEMMGRDVPQDLISSFLKDLGVEPVSENGGRTAQEAEDRYEETTRTTTTRRRRRRRRFVDRGSRFWWTPR